MNLKELAFILPLFILITLCFFYKSIALGQIPFPGDLLIAEYKPWRSSSYLGYNPGSYPNKAQYFDTLRQIYPWKTLAIDLIHHHSLPLWNPYNFSGSPLLANHQSAVIYPLNIIYLIFPQHIAWTIMVILQYIMAALFTYLLSRSIGVSIGGSLLASLSFSFSLYMTVFSQYVIIGHTVLWLPFLIWCIKKFLNQKRVLFMILYSVGILFAGLAGHLQVFVIVLLVALISGFVLVFVERRSRKQTIQTIFQLIVFTLLALSLLSVQLFPTIELISLSARANHDYPGFISRLLIQPYQLVLAFIPDLFGNPATRNYLIADTYPTNALYIGMIPLLFTIIGIVNRRKETMIRILGIGIIVILLLTVRTPLSEFIYRFPLPLVSTSSPSNGLFALAFLLSLAAGLGFDAWISHRIYSINKTMSLLSILFILPWVAKFFGQPISSNNLLYSTVFFVGTSFLFFIARLFKKQTILIAVGLLFFTALDLFYFFHKFNPFVPPALVFPETQIFSWLQDRHDINRFWGYGTAQIQANFATQYRLYSPDGYDPLYPKIYGELLPSSKDGKLVDTFTNQNRSDAEVTPGFGEEDFAANTYRRKLLNLLGVAYIIDRDENATTQKTFPPDVFPTIFQQNGWKIYRNTQALPRFFLATAYQVFHSQKEFSNIFFSPTFNPRTTLLLPESQPNVATSNDNPGSSELISYTPNNVSIQTRAQSSQLLFLSDTYYPGWKAFVDGKETNILRADYAFRAVAVPPGDHLIVFRFLPLSFSWGLKTSIIGLFGLITYMCAVRLRNRGGNE